MRFRTDGRATPVVTRIPDKLRAYAFFVCRICQRRLTLTLLATASLVFAARAYGQQVQPVFNMHLETLPLQQQEDMRNFNRNLTDYVEGYTWMDRNLPEPVQLHMEAFLAYRGSRIKAQYGAKLTVSNGLDIKYLDRWWFFEFERDDILRHDTQNFHSVTWLIDYYTHLMIGHEMDKYTEFGGDEHFRRAEAICMQGRFDPEYQRGWDERLERVQQILSDDHKPYRLIRARFYNAMMLEKAKNNAEARRLCRQVIDMLSEKYRANPKDEWIKAFFSAHYLKLADVFRTETVPEVYERLKALDPDHQNTYDEYIGKLGR